MDNCTTKRCTRCKSEFPATNDYFYHCKSSKDGWQYHCKQCCNAYSLSYSRTENGRRQRRQYYEQNRDAVNELNKGWRERNKETWAATNVRNVKLWRERNPEKHKEQVRRGLAKPENKEKARERGRKRAEERRLAKANEPPKPPRAVKPDTLVRREYKQEHYRKNKADYQASGHKRRVAEKQADGHHTGKDIQKQFDSQRGLCWWCGELVDPKDYHVDHRIPLDKGGSNGARNICISCPTCNLSKGHKWSWEFNGRLL